jgi:hypothetical protein
MPRILDRFFSPYRPPGAPVRYTATNRMAFAKALWVAPQSLGLASLGDPQREALAMPAPPKLRRLLTFYAGFLQQRPELARALGIPEDLLAALIRGELDTGRLLQLAQALTKATEEHKLVLAEALRTMNRDIEAAAERVAQAAADPLEAARIRSRFIDAERQQQLQAGREGGKQQKVGGKRDALKRRKEAAARAVEKAALLKKLRKKDEKKDE